MSRLFRLLILLPALLLILPAVAQDSAKQSRTVRILFLNAPQGAPRTLHLYDGSVSREVELPRMNLSVPYELPGGPLKLRLLAQPVEVPGQVPPAAPEVIIPEAIGDAYLLCFSDPANPVVPVRVEVVDAGKDKFRDGQMLWFNLTPFAVGGTLGDEKFLLKPQGRALVDAPVRGQDSYPVMIAYMIKEDKQVYPICETRWMQDPGSRQLVFVFNEPGRQLPRVCGFTDYRPPPPPSAETP